MAETAISIVIQHVLLTVVSPRSEIAEGFPKQSESSKCVKTQELV